MSPGTKGTKLLSTCMLWRMRVRVLTLTNIYGLLYSLQVLQEVLEGSYRR